MSTIIRVLSSETAGPPRQGVAAFLRPVWEVVASRPANEDVQAAAALRAWGQRVGLRARDAIFVGTRLASYSAASHWLSSAVSTHFGADHPGHAFNSEPHRWLRVTEVQTTKALATFLDEGGPARVSAFLRALSPEVPWPRIFDRVWADAEVPADRGRIDLLLRGRSGAETWGAVVEAKFGHHLRDNPLSSYRRTAMSYGLRPFTPGNNAAGVVFRILGQADCATTQRRLRRNRDWAFVAWRPVLLRFERELRGLEDDVDFRRFRRTLWERAG